MCATSSESSFYWAPKPDVRPYVVLECLVHVALLEDSLHDHTTTRAI
jgi:hypothetical protein